MKLPVPGQALHLAIKGRRYPAVCIDLFDGGYGWYFDATLSKDTRYRFKAGEQCGVPELGPGCLADFVSYPTSELWKVRLLISK